MSLLIFCSAGEAFGEKRSDLLGREIHYTDNQATEEVLFSVELSDLCGGLLHANLRPKIDRELVRRLPCFGEALDSRDFADAEVNPFEILVGNDIHKKNEEGRPCKGRV